MEDIDPTHVVFYSFVGGVAIALAVAFAPSIIDGGNIYLQVVDFLLLSCGIVELRLCYNKIIDIWWVLYNHQESVHRLNRENYRLACQIVKTYKEAGLCATNEALQPSG